MKRYENHEELGAKCFDCGLDYADPGWVDAVIPDEIWERINPTYHRGSGLLCLTCIARRCAELGLEDVPVMLFGEAIRSVDWNSKF